MSPLARIGCLQASVLGNMRGIFSISKILDRRWSYWALSGFDISNSQNKERFRNSKSPNIWVESSMMRVSSCTPTPHPIKKGRGWLQSILNFNSESELFCYQQQRTTVHAKVSKVEKKEVISPMVCIAPSTSTWTNLISLNETNWNKRGLVNFINRHVLVPPFPRPSFVTTIIAEELGGSPLQSESG